MSGEAVFVDPTGRRGRAVRSGWALLPQVLGVGLILFGVAVLQAAGLIRLPYGASRVLPGPLITADGNRDAIAVLNAAVMALPPEVAAAVLPLPSTGAGAPSQSAVPDPNSTSPTGAQRLPARLNNPEPVATTETTSVPTTAPTFPTTTTTTATTPTIVPATTAPTTAPSTTVPTFPTTTTTPTTVPATTAPTPTTTAPSTTVPTFPITTTTPTTAPTTTTVPLTGAQLAQAATRLRQAVAASQPATSAGLTAAEAQGVCTAANGFRANANVDAGCIELGY